MPEEPGEAVTFNRKVLAKPSTVHRVHVDAKYQSITKQVVVDPGGVEEIPIPAEYQTVMVEDVMPARATGAYEVSGQYGDVAVNVPVEEERWEWRRVVCETGTYLEPTVSAPAYEHHSSSYTTSSSHQSAPTTTYHQSSHASGGNHNVSAYEGVCRENEKREECYGQDVIEAYMRNDAREPVVQDNSGGHNSDHYPGFYEKGPDYNQAMEALDNDYERRRSPRFRR